MSSVKFDKVFFGAKNAVRFFRFLPPYVCQSSVLRLFSLRCIFRAHFFQCFAVNWVYSAGVRLASSGVKCHLNAFPPVKLEKALFCPVVQVSQVLAVVFIDLQMLISRGTASICLHREKVSSIRCLALSWHIKETVLDPRLSPVVPRWRYSSTRTFLGLQRHPALSTSIIVRSIEGFHLLFHIVPECFSTGCGVRYRTIFWNWDRLQQLLSLCRLLLSTHLTLSRVAKWLIARVENNIVCGVVTVLLLGIS